jgi:hypothetical protein
MAIVPQRTLFQYIQIEEIGDLSRLVLAIENIPDENLMRILEDERGNGRDDYPIRAMWNSILAGTIFQHASIASLIRELKRNGQLRAICGFTGKMPGQHNYSRFLKSLTEHQDEIDAMFNLMVKRLKNILPDFGEILAGDGKALESFANRTTKRKVSDGRSEADANLGIKRALSKDKDEKTYVKIKSWFGYRLHLIVDAQYELPVAYEVTKASTSEQVVMSEMMEKLNKTHESITKKCNIFTADKGYDSQKFNKSLYDEYGIKPVIDMTNQWKDKEEIRMFEHRNNIVGYNNGAEIFCYGPKTGERHMMQYEGFEKDRSTLRYGCPVKSGANCKGCNECPYGNKSVRISMKEDRRRFTPVARSSYKWKRLYKKRTSVERVNSRLDVSYGFERHTIRGKKKMKIRVSMALLIMLTLAYGHIKRERPELMRSLVRYG